MAVTKDEFNYVKNNVPMEWVMGYYGIEKGNNGNYKCIFGGHEDKHPSMHVYQKTNTCKCFACGGFGDVITVVSKLDGIPAYMACLKLEEEYGIKEFEGERYREKNWVYDVKNILPLSAADLRFIGLEPYPKAYAVRPEDSEQLQEELKRIEEDYNDPTVHIRRDVSLHTLQVWTSDDYLKPIATTSMLSEYKEDPELVVTIIQNKINEMYSYLSTLPISGETELKRERLEKLQDKMEKLYHNKKYQQWIEEIHQNDTLEEDTFEMNDLEVLER